MDKLSILRQIVLKLQQILTLQKKLVQERFVRDMCLAEGLTIEQTDLVVATLWCESGMNPDAVNKNADGTTDWGLCQFNDYWYSSVISPDVALHNPGKALEVMIAEVKAGRLKNWICYRSGKYKKFL